MLSSLKSTIFSGWNLNRWFRLSLGIIILIQYFQQKDIFIALIAVTLLLQAIFNVACCGSGNCAVNDKKPSSKSIEETSYEEIK
ncbi:MAG: hypothetical protein JNM67_04455 [Bacteroidetes bacterium]|nr:hypothetical protein [Bacteroidota bacterium]